MFQSFFKTGQEKMDQDTTWWLRVPHTVSVKGVQVNCRFDSRLIAVIHFRFGLVITPTLNTQVPYLIPLTSRTHFGHFKGIQGSYRDISGLLFRAIVPLKRIQKA